jgi:hypothetical protein
VRVRTSLNNYSFGAFNTEFFSCKNKLNPS